MLKIITGYYHIKKLIFAIQLSHYWYYYASLKKMSCLVCTVTQLQEVFILWKSKMLSSLLVEEGCSVAEANLLPSYWSDKVIGIPSRSSSPFTTVQLTGNVARRYSRVPQWNPLRGPNADIPCTRPASNCVDNRQPREYF